MNRRSLLPLQNYVTLLSLFLILEHFLTYRYESYLNDVGHPGVAGVFLVLVSVIGAARNSMSLYLLCLASMGLSIVRPTLGGALGRVRLLALFHLVFGILYVGTFSLSKLATDRSWCHRRYSLGFSALSVDSEGFFVIFFVIPLALTLTAFLTWISESPMSSSRQNESVLTSNAVFSQCTR